MMEDNGHYITRAARPLEDRERKPENVFVGPISGGLATRVMKSPLYSEGLNEQRE
jgi:hypothetical protein